MRDQIGEFFSPPWWRAFLDCWNESRHRGSLANFGTMCLRLVGPTEQSVWIRWDAEGRAELVRAVADCPRISATQVAWVDFLSGKSTATSAILTGRLRLKGDLGTLVPYALAFNNLGTVARDAGLVPA